MNSVDASGNESLDDTLEQIRLIVEAGIDFIEISGGNYENPRMMQESNTTDEIPEKDSKPANSRESFFLQFAQTVREKFPSVVLMVTGGFRTRTGMEAALQSGACDLIGIARPAAVLPKLPKEIILNIEIPDDEATVTLAPLKVPFLLKYLPVKQVGVGYQSQYYAGQIQRMAKGLLPVNTRI
jgi:2,4-dienoyl-CoA reductase-like NADH-dependent reductase (Old Yellow Enzyme family)